MIVLNVDLRELCFGFLKHSLQSYTANKIGSITKKQADEKAKLEYDAFAEGRRKLKELKGENSDFYTLENILKDTKREK